MRPKLDSLLCTACQACVSLCPVGCISMKVDELGFLRPCIDETACVECGLCESTCQKVKSVPKCPERQIYAAKHNDRKVLKNSASGGVFTALSDIILANGGIVVGACYDDNMMVKHKIATSVEERDAMRGSKYTYSLCDKSVYCQVKQQLEDGKEVLFSGTPCQVAALKTFLGKTYDKLVLVDILCHGIAAPFLYKDYITHLESKRGSVAYIDFRYSPNGNWHEPQTRVTYKNGKKRCGETENSYFRMFVRNYCLRECCYTCNYAQFDRVSDITLGDFWGIEKSLPDFDSPYGVSIVVINTSKGSDIFTMTHPMLLIKQCTETDCSHHQLHGLPHSGRNENFLSDYCARGFEYVHKKYTTIPRSIRLRERLYRIKLIKFARDLLKGK